MNMKKYNIQIKHNLKTNKKKQRSTRNLTQLPFIATAETLNSSSLGTNRSRALTSSRTKRCTELQFLQFQAFINPLSQGERRRRRSEPRRFAGKLPTPYKAWCAPALQYCCAQCAIGVGSRAARGNVFVGRN